VGEGVHGLVGGVVQGRQGEGVQIQQLSVGRVPLWQDQILERHCEEGFCSQPGVCHSPAHEIVCDSQQLYSFCRLSQQQPVVCAL